MFASRRRRGSTPRPIVWLLASQLVLSLGVCAMFPFIPLYVRRHGGGAVAVAVFVAGPLLANALVQIPAGRLIDRVGRRPVLVVALGCYALLSGLLALDAGPLWLLGMLRAGQGIFGGAYNPAMRASIGDLTPPERRAERFGLSQTVFMVGLLVGPAFGGALAAISQSLVFLCTAVAAGGACALVALRVPETREHGLAAALAAGEHHPQRRAAGAAWWRVRGVLVPMAGLCAMGLVMSMYDVVWPLYLTSRGQSVVVIGLSITLYAVPLLLLSRSGGRLADRGNRRVMLAVDFGVAALCALSYPWLHALWVILLIGFIEAVSWVATEPILYAVLTDAVPAQVRGRAMAAGGFGEYAGSAVGALALGSLYGVGEGIPFWSGSAVLVLAGVVCAVMVPARAVASARAARVSAEAAVEAAVPVSVP